tara:strand:- start:919 stop:1755 length:837 start_codon:yes stop_codon:yes gene_type:complete
MTGFGLSKSLKKDSEVFIEIKGVNHRFLEVTIKPNDLGNELDQYMRNSITKSVNRGKIDIRVKLKSTSRTDYSINASLIKKLENTLKKNTNLDTKIGFSDIKDVPGIFNAEVTHKLNIRTVKKEFKNALKDFLDSRSKEGIKIKKTLKKKILKSESLIKNISNSCNKNLKKRISIFKSKVSKFTQDYDESRINQEITLLALKQDVSEELDRILFHINSLKKEINKKDCSGKKIDFILQEFFREANTLTVKLDDPSMMNRAIDVKILIEEMREQTQNVE